MEKKEKKKRKSTATIKKAATRGITTQKPMTVKIDEELLPYLSAEQNKGRLINTLLREHYGVK